MKTKTYTHPITKAVITKKEYMNYMFDSQFMDNYNSIEDQLKSISLY
jgi:hypothetical protein